MPNNKRQHFVPKSYQQNFSREGKTIGCVLIKNGLLKVVEDAPIKSQAYGDYFYSKDISLEQEISKVEGEANIIIQKILSSEPLTLESGEIQQMKEYVLFQHIRTPHYANQHEKDMNRAYQQIGGSNDIQVIVPDKQLFILRTFLPHIEETAGHFNLLIVDNQTDIPFITSPEPSIYFNPYQMQRGNDTFGLLTFGGMLFMPLSSKKALLLYDPKAYEPQNEPVVACSLSSVSNLNARVLEYLDHTNAGCFYYDNRISDFWSVMEIMLQHITEDLNLDFIQERDGIGDDEANYPFSKSALFPPFNSK